MQICFFAIYDCKISLPLIKTAFVMDSMKFGYQNMISEYNSELKFNI